MIRIALLSVAILAMPVAALADCGIMATLTAKGQGKLIYAIGSGHMKPAFEPSDCPVFLRFDPSAGAEALRTGIISYRHPAQMSDPDYASRVVAIGGDRISLSDGQVILNGTPIPQVPAAPYLQRMEPEGPKAQWPRCPSPAGAGALCEIRRVTEIWPGDIRFDTLDTGEGFGRSTEVFTVPAGHVFVLGDNRGNSLDSRYSLAQGGPGFIPVENIVGIWAPTEP